MPRHHNLAAAPVSYPSPPAESGDGLLSEAVSATSVSFVACGAAVADLGELLRELRLALPASTTRAASPETDRAAALLGFRLQAVRGVLDEATAAIGSVLEDCAPGDDRE